MNGSSAQELFASSDLEQLRSAGIDPEEARRQILLLRTPPGYAALDRPCTPGDGIRLVPGSDREALSRRYDEAAGSGRCSRFVPASGAATRMFRALVRYRALDGLDRAKIDADAAAGDGDAAGVATFLDNVDRFAFRGDLERLLRERGLDLASCHRKGAPLPILDALLSPEGMGYSGRPKALIAFHGYGDGPRTAFEEHLVEAAGLVADSKGIARIHFTIAEAERIRFQRLLEDVRSRYEEALGCRLEVGFSSQKPSSDALAVDPGGRPFRLEDGSLLLRPSGHGALIENLIDLQGDVVLIKNIDNVVPDRLKADTLAWSRTIAGLAVELQERSFTLLERLEKEPPDPEAAEEALAFAADWFHRSPTPDGGGRSRHEEAADLLARPVRVCGMVRNTGEPGGGPFWAPDHEGRITPQIVEGAQVDPGSASQQKTFRSSSHSNPVFMACALRDPRREPWDLRRFVDPAAVIIARKSYGGRDLLCLERPGLWNGAMAGWNTVFVEVPLETFNPVKTVNDLLRQAHQPG